MTLASSEAAHGFLNLQVQWWEWVALLSVGIVMIIIDLAKKVDHETPAAVTAKRALRLVMLFVATGALYGVFILVMHGGEAAGLYYATWGTEYSLSVDNLFMIMIILDTFKVPKAFRHKILFLGVFGALVFRFVFIFIGAILLDKFAVFVMPVMFAAVAFSAVKVWNDTNDQEVEEMRSYKFLQNHLPIAPGRNYGGRFFVRVVNEANGKLQFAVTYLFVCLSTIELVDVGFSVDSVPTALAITSEPYLVFASNAMALLGLRQIFFVIDPWREKLSRLSQGLSLVLGWVAFKLAWAYVALFVDGWPHIPVWLTLTVIVTLLVGSIVASLKWPKKEGGEEKSEPPIFHAAMVVHGGESYRRELADGMLQRVHDEVLEAVGKYDTDGEVPVVIAREVPEFFGAEYVDLSASAGQLLENGTHGEVNMAAAIREALSRLPDDEPALVAVISDFQIADRDELEALVDELAYSGRQVFLKLVFATSDEEGDDKLPQSLDDRHTGVRDKVDAVYATHYNGVPNESVAEHFGRELDALERLIRRTRTEGTSEPSLVG